MAIGRVGSTSVGCTAAGPGVTLERPTEVLSGHYLVVAFAANGTNMSATLPDGT